MTYDSADSLNIKAVMGRKLKPCSIQINSRTAIIEAVEVSFTEDILCLRSFMFFEISKSGVLGLEVSLPGAKKKERKKKHLKLIKNRIREI